MPDVPARYLDPKARQAAAAAKAASRLYWVHPTVTVWEYMNELTTEQRNQVQAECRQIERAKQQAKEQEQQ